MPEGRRLVIVERKERGAAGGSGLKVANTTRGIHAGVVTLGIVKDVGIKAKVGADYLPARAIARHIQRGLRWESTTHLQQNGAIRELTPWIRSKVSIDLLMAVFIG